MNSTDRRVNSRAPPIEAVDGLPLLESPAADDIRFADSGCLKVNTIAHEPLMQTHRDVLPAKFVGNRG